MASSDIEIHNRMGIDLDRLYHVGPVRRVVRKDQDQQFDPEQRLKSSKKHSSHVEEESSEPEDFVTLNQGLPTDNLDDFWYHSYSGESGESSAETPQTPSSSDEDFILHIDLKEKEPE